MVVEHVRKEVEVDGREGRQDLVGCYVNNTKRYACLLVYGGLAGWLVSPC